MLGMAAGRVPWGADHHRAFRQVFDRSAGMVAICEDLPRGACHWYYYVLSPEGDGSHVFAVTLAQHEANVEAAREAGVL